MLSISATSSSFTMSCSTMPLDRHLAACIVEPCPPTTVASRANSTRNRSDQTALMLKRLNHCMVHFSEGAGRGLATGGFRGDAAMVGMGTGLQIPPRTYRLVSVGRPSFDGTRACGQGQVQHEPLATRSHALPFAASDGWRAGVRGPVGFVLHKVCLHANGWLVRPCVTVAHSGFRPCFALM